MKTEEGKTLLIARLSTYGAVISEKVVRLSCLELPHGITLPNEAFSRMSTLQQYGKAPHPMIVCPFEEFGMPDGFTLRVCGWTVGCSAASTPCT